MLYVLTAVGLALSGCTSGPSGSSKGMVDDFCYRCAEYVGDASRPGPPPAVDDVTRQAMIENEAGGRESHIGPIAATIVRRYRDDARAVLGGARHKVFDKDATDVDREFVRWTQARFGVEEPWKIGDRPTLLADVYRWIAKNRAALPPCKLLDSELKKAESLR